MNLTSPLRLQLDVEQETTHEPFRLVRADDGFVTQAKVGGAWKALYRFELTEQFAPDYEVANWFTSTHPSSQFTRTLMAARAVPGRRFALRDNQLAVHALDGTTERRTLRSAGELRQALEETFAIRLPQAPELDATLARIAAA
jgi:N-hydroxyarylamine O-acetyltransferase